MEKGEVVHENLEKKITGILAILSLCFFLNSCVTVIPPTPDSGIWVCEEDGITLDFDKNTAELEYEGNVVTTELAIGYGGTVDLLYNNSDAFSTLFMGDYFYVKEKEVFYIYPDFRILHGEEKKYYDMDEIPLLFVKVKQEKS